MNFGHIDFLNTELKKLNHYFNKKNYNLVIKNSIIIIKKYKNAIPFYNFLGLSYRYIGKIDQAEKIFLDAYKIDSKNSDILTNLGSLYKFLENYSKSKKYFELGLKQNPNNINLLCNYGNLKRELNDIDGSILLYKKAYKINNNNSLVLQNLAGSYQILGKPNLSKKYLKVLLKNFPNITVINKIFSDIINYKKNDKHQKQMLLRLKNNFYTEEQKIPLYFALAKSYDDQDNLSESFKYLKLGNNTQKNILNKKLGYDE